MSTEDREFTVALLGGPPPSDSKASQMTTEKAMLHWDLAPKDTQRSLQKLDRSASFADLDRMLIVYDSIFDKSLRKSGRERMPSGPLLALWVNDYARASRPSVGAMKHTWPLQRLHDGSIGRSGDQTFDLPIFYADIEWSDEQKREYEGHPPVQRLRESTMTNPLLWKNPSTRALRIRLLRPSTIRKEGRVVRFEFGIVGGNTNGPVLGNKTVLLLWLGSTLIFTSVEELLACRYIQSPAEYRKRLAFVDSFGADAERSSGGPVLIKKAVNDGCLELDLLLLPYRRASQVWLRGREVGRLGEGSIGEKLIARFRAELQKGDSGLGGEWADHYDCIMAGR